jgi:hypothetical protein
MSLVEPTTRGSTRFGSTAGLVDCGSLRVPVPHGVEAQVEQRPGERSVGVHLPLPTGHLRVHVLAAPRSRPLWEEVAGEIFDAQLHAGNRIHREYGPFGEEVVFTSASDGSVNRFIGIDGPRWLLYGVATSHDRGRALTETLRYVLYHTVVVRGEEAYPAKAPLPLLAPGAASEQPAADAGANAPWRNATATLVSTQAAMERPPPPPAQMGTVPEPRVTSSNAMPAVPPRTVPTRGRELSIGRSWLAGPLRPIRRLSYEWDPPTIPIRLIGR